MSERNPLSGERVLQYLLLGLLGTGCSGFALLDVAEVQGIAITAHRLQDPGSRDVPVLVLSLGAVVLVSAVPLVLAGIGILRRWAPVDYLFWSFCAVLALLMFAAVIAFSTYRFWRDDQLADAIRPTPRSYVRFLARSSPRDARVG
jgi:hypothetical protein